MNVPYVECKDEEPTLSLMPLQVKEGTVSPAQLALLAASAQLAMKGCECGGDGGVAVYAAVPEWWQIRPEGKRPQLVLQFCAKLPDGKFGPPKYALTIPHPKNVQKPLNAPLPKYKKGSFEGELKLADNSKIIVNCESQKEAERVLDILKGLVTSVMLKGSTIKYSERRGKPVQRHEMFARIVTYFEKGIEDSADFKWKKKFDLPTSSTNISS